MATGGQVVQLQAGSESAKVDLENVSPQVPHYSKEFLDVLSTEFQNLRNPGVLSAIFTEDLAKIRKTRRGSTFSLEIASIEQLGEEELEEVRRALEKENQERHDFLIPIQVSIDIKVFTL